MNQTKQILVIGGARSGIAAARLLKKQGFDVLLTDMKPLDPADKESLEAAGIEVADGGHPEWIKEKDYDFIVKNPGIPYHAPLVAFFKEKGTPIYTEIETAYQAAPGFSYGAITGTDGKTTITTMLHEMLKAKDPKALVAGNIGIPLSECVLNHGEETLDVALELSNFQLLGIDTFRPAVSTISNLAPDHLDYMDSLDEYYRSKFAIVKNCTKEDAFILNLDDPTIVSLAEEIGIPARLITFSLSNPAADLHVENRKAILNDTVLFDLDHLHLVGSFNLANAMMAAAMAYTLGVSPEQIDQTLDAFHGVEHRIEYVGEKDGIKFYNDSKATNTHSAEAALSAFDRPVYLLAGGKDKGIDYSVLKQYDDRVKKCFSFGQIKDQFASIFSKQESLETMEEALDAALKEAKDGDVILLCPATSSFDQFKNYEVRGEEFKRMVHERMEQA